VKNEELGKGAFGIVFKCFDTDTHKYFVAKETRSQTAEVLRNLAVVKAEVFYGI
jgi:hypothetical protein